MMTARLFPIEVQDAFFNAFRLPNFFRRLLGEGALSVSFIPIFVDILKGKSSPDQDERARAFAGAVFAVLLSLTITLSLLGIVFMDPLIRFWLQGDAYSSVPGKIEMTIRLARIMFGFLVLITLYAFFMAILNSLKRFALTAFAPCLFNLALIGAAWTSPSRAQPETVLAWAVIVGGVLQMGILIPAVWRSGYISRPNLNLRSPEFKRMLKILVPSLFGMSILQVTTLINAAFASRLPQGSHSYIYYADRILELPLSLFAVSLGTALLPTLAGQWAQQRRDEMARTMNHGLRLIGLVSVPASVAMIAMAGPIVELLFLGGHFTYDGVGQTAGLIQVYAVGLLVSGAVRVLSQGFYAIQNTWFPALAAALALVSHLFFVWGLMATFGLRGLAMSTILSASVQLVLLALAHHRWIAPLDLKGWLKGLLIYTVCAAPMALLFLFYDQYFAWLRMLVASIAGPDLVPIGPIRAGAVLSTLFVGGLLYAGMAGLLKVPEFKEVWGSLLRRVRRRRSAI
jgi:putative peptidoglycan lipid II flippase